MSDASRLALFDFDGTLCAGNTLHLLMRHLLAERRGVPGLLTWSLLRKLRLAGTRRFKEGVLAALRGMPKDEVARLGQDIYAARVRPELHASGLRELQGLRAQGYRVIVVTGAFDFMVEPFCREHGVEDLLCCRVELRDGRCTGRIDGPEMLGADKVPALRAHLRDVAVDWAGSRAYTDHVSDQPMLDLVGGRFHIKGGSSVIPGAELLDWNQHPAP